jgi:hypothetical protein
MAIDPSIFLIGIWSNLESHYSANRVVSLAQSDSRFQSSSNNNFSTRFCNPSKGLSFRSHQHSHLDSNKTSQCIFVTTLIPNEY